MVLIQRCWVLSLPLLLPHALLLFYFMRYLFSLVLFLATVKKDEICERSRIKRVRQIVAGQLSSGYWGLFYHSLTFFLPLCHTLSLSLSLSILLYPLPTHLSLSPALANIYISTCWSRRANRQKMKLQTHPINHTHTHTHTALSPGQYGMG